MSAFRKRISSSRSSTSGSSTSKRKSDADDDFLFVDGDELKDCGVPKVTSKPALARQGGLGSPAMPSKDRSSSPRLSKPGLEPLFLPPHRPRSGSGKSMTLPARSRAQYSSWDRESSDDEEAGQSNHSGDNSGDEEIDGGFALMKRRSPRLFRRHNVKSAACVNTSSLPAHMVGQRSHSMLSTTGTDKFDGSVPEITMCPPPALDAESSEPEADKRHPSLTKLSTESMYSGVPLANLVHDMPHMKREQVCIAYREVLSTVMSLLGSDRRLEVGVRSLLQYAEQVFQIPSAVSKGWVAEVNASACKSSVLHIEVVEARNLAAMDANGFSDPYVCMCMEQPQGMELKVREIQREREASVDGFTTMDDAHGQMAMTSVYKKTLNPKWEEKRVLKIHDASTDILKLIMMDRDERKDSSLSSMKINVKGLTETFRHLMKHETDDFMGRISIPIESIPYEGNDVWWPIRQQHSEDLAKGELRLKLSFQLTSIPPPPPGLRHSDTLHMLVTSLILHDCKQLPGQKPRATHDSVEDDDCIDGDEAASEEKHILSCRLTERAKFILGQFVVQREIPKSIEAYVNWMVRLELFLERRIVPGELMDSLQQLNLRISRSSSELSDNEERNLAEGLNKFVSLALKSIKEVNTSTFPPQVKPGEQEGMLIMVSALKLIYSMSVWRKHFPDRLQPRACIEKSLEIRVNTWYECATKPAKMEVQTLEDVCTCVDKMRDIVGMLLETFKKIHEAYGTIFSKVHLDYHTFLLKQTDKHYSNDIKQVVNTAMQLLHKSPTASSQEMVHRVSSQLYRLYVTVKEFSGKLSSVKLSPGESLQASNCHQWFAPVLPYWLDVWEHETRKQVVKAIEIDPMEKTNTSSALFSCSGVDVLARFSQLVVETKDFLNWPDAITSFTVTVRITDILCQFALMYATAAHGKLLKLVKASEKLPIIDNKLCIPISNIEHIRSEGITQLPALLQFEQVTMRVYSELQAAAMEGLNLEDIAQAYTGTLTRLVSQTTDHMEAASAPAFNHYCKQIGVRVRRVLREYPDSKSIESVMSNLFPYLMTNFNVLRTGIQKKAYKRFLCRLWQVIIQVVMEVIKEKSPRDISFYSKLGSVFTTADASNGFFWFFLTQTEADMRVKNLEIPELRTLRTLLKYQQNGTPQLILDFYHEQCKEYTMLVEDESPCLGSMMLQCALVASRTTSEPKERSIFVNLVHYKDMPTSNPDGSVSFYITVSIHPAQDSTHVAKATHKTGVYHDSMAFADDTFDLLVPSDWVRQRGLSLRICAYQEGRITSTDTLLGLVMIPLQNIDEVERSQCSKQQGQTKEFALNFDTFSRPSVKNIVTILESRASADQEARRFLHDEQTLAASIKKRLSKHQEPQQKRPKSLVDTFTTGLQKRVEMRPTLGSISSSL